MLGSEEIEKVHTYCIHCAALCGVVTYLRNGYLVKVEGDAESSNNRGTLCPKGLAAKQEIYHPNRLRYPMKRTRAKGATDPGWIRIGWDEALETIASKMLEIRKRYGPEAFFFQKGSTGGSSGTEWYPFFNRLSNIFGSPNFGGTAHICCYTRHCPGLTLTLGISNIPPSIDYEKTNCMLIVGYNVLHTQPNLAHKILDARDRGAKLIVVDPTLSPTASKADIWLAPRPGTDLALFLAMHHVIMKKNLYDAEFLKRWTNAPFLVREDSGLFLRSEDGKDFVVWNEATSRPANADPWIAPDVNPALYGRYCIDGVECRPAWHHFSDLVESCTPRWAEEVTWIPQDRIRYVSELFATMKPASIDWYNGLMRHTNTYYTGIALALLAVVTGNWDERGGLSFASKFKLADVRGNEYLPKDWIKRSLVDLAGFKVTSLDLRQVGPMSLVAEAILTGKPYPIKGMLSLGSGLGTSNPNSKKMMKALERLEFLAMGDIWKTPAMDMADIILPCATPWESEFINYNPPYIMHRRPVVKPLYEARSDLDIIFALAKRLGYDGFFWDGDLRKAFDHLLKPFGITLEDLDRDEKGVYYALPEPRFRKYSVKDPATGRFRGVDTPTGKLEIYSEKLKTLGYAPLPVWREPEPGPLSTPELFTDFPFILTFTPRPMHWIHGQLRAVPWLRECEREPTVWINARTAKTLGIDEGDQVMVETPDRNGLLYGHIKLRAHLTESVHPKCIAVPYGWWQGCEALGLEEYGNLDGSANVNNLIDDSFVDRISGTIGMGSYPCRIRRV